MKNLKLSMLEFTPVPKEASRQILGGQAPSDYGACPINTRDNISFSGFCADSNSVVISHSFNRFCRDTAGELMVVRDWFNFQTGASGSCLWTVV